MSLSKLRAVSRITGMAAVRGSRRTARQRERPERRGIITSVTITSGTQAASTLRASAPSSADLAT